MQGVPKIKNIKLWVTKSIQEYVVFDIYWFFFDSSLYFLYPEVLFEHRLVQFYFLEKPVISRVCDFDRI